LGIDKIRFFREEDYGNHGKIFICDDEYCVIGSFNFLSNRGKTNEEEAVIIYDEKTLLYYRAKLFYF